MAFVERRWTVGGKQYGPSLHVVLAAALTLSLGFGVAATVDAFAPPGAGTKSAFVKVIHGGESGTGHGSATHIGGGLYVTAAHLLHGPLSIDGAAASIVLENAEYDIAVLRGPEQLDSVPLACVTPQVGEVAQAHGNPLELDNITTTVTVAGAAQELYIWKLIVPVDGTILPGMSGGGVVIDGALVGVNVGIITDEQVPGFPIYSGISIIVPSSVVCDLMGRS